jgi:tripartite-type tricarboxylate transporter receptor subunit TctC
VKTIDDARARELVVGGTGGAADTDQFPKVLNALLGTRMRLVAGYPGGNDINLAMERGEVQGRCGWSWSSVVSTRANWLKEGRISVLVQLSMKKHEDLPNTPLVLDLAKTDEERRMLRLVFARQAMGRPFVAPPDVPADRIKILRDAFMATMKDKQFLAEAAKGQIEIDPVSGEEIQNIVREAYATPAELVKRVANIVK